MGQKQPMTNRTQSVFFFAIIFLFATGLGLLVFRNYNEYYVQQTSAELETAQASETPVPQPKKPVATTTPDQVSGWQTYTNAKYDFTFDYPTTLELKEDPVYQLPDGNGNLFDVLTISLTKDSTTGFSVNMNRPSAGCGEIAERISSTTFQANGVTVTKNVEARPDTNSKCFEYIGFKQGDNGIYMLGSIPANDQSYEKIFDSIVKSFKFTS
jgi:hypothetical protein